VHREHISRWASEYDSNLFTFGNKLFYVAVSPQRSQLHYHTTAAVRRERVKTGRNRQTPINAMLEEQ
jgi:hypothetical protein